MSVEELQKLTNDNLKGSLQVRQNVLMFAETHRMACTISYTEYPPYNERFHRRVKYVHDCQSDIGENKRKAANALLKYLSC